MVHVSYERRLPATGLARDVAYERAAALKGADQAAVERIELVIYRPGSIDRLRRIMLWIALHDKAVVG